MNASQIALEEKKNKTEMMPYNSENIRFQGKDIKIAKLKKNITHKPRLTIPVLINLSIILAIIGILLIVFYL